MSEPASPPHHLNQQELAADFGVSRRTVQTWDKEGLREAAVVSEDPLTYDGLMAWRWRWNAKRKDKATLTDAKLRKLEAEAEQKEVELATMRGDLVDVRATEQVWGDTLTRLRAKIIAFKGALAPRLVGMDSPREAKAVLDDAFDELLAVLVGTADEIESDDAAA